MLNLHSLNATAYISYITGEFARVFLDKGDNKENLNHYRFRKTADVMNAYNDYRQSIANNKEVKIDIIKYNKLIKHYKDARDDFKKSTNSY